MSPKTGEKTLDYYMSLPYKVELTHDEDGWFAKVIDLPGCMTWANTFEELHPMIEDAKRGWIEDALEYGDPVPEPRSAKDFSGKVNLRMPKSLHRDLARQAENEGVSLNQLMVSHLAQGAGSSSSTEQTAATSPQREEASVQEIVSRDWQQEVRRALEEYEELLQEKDITPLASSRIITDSANLLSEFSNELTSISDRAVEISNKLVADTKKRRYKPRKLKELETAFASLTETFHTLNTDFEKLAEFCSRAIEEHKVRFGDQPDQGAYSAVREAEMILQKATTKVRRVDE
ncbi:MAG: toxin-antitoxin system HicB family antitoxin [Rubrobacter sp.]|nr:toxin-antitoxin system HicB family antitoxin [Rubrobacter sp.]